MLSKFSVKKPYTVFVGVVISIILGIVSFTKMTADLLPSISLPYVIVMTTYPGASPETVEMAVTQPVEASMATVSNIETINSVSNENYSMVILEFSQNADMNAVSLEIREKLDQIKGYWDDSVGNPVIMRLNPDMLPVMIAAVSMEGMDYAEISDYVKETISPNLESIEGVASVNAIGLLEESVNVLIRQDKIDYINEQIQYAIDEKMREAEEQLEDGRQELEDGKQELEDSRQELIDSQSELEDGLAEIDKGKDELEKGKKELKDKQDSVYEELASKKSELLSAKSNLEGIKSNLETAKKLKDGISEIDKQLTGLQIYLTCSTDYQTAMQEYMTAMTGLVQNPTDASLLAQAEEARKKIETIKKTVTGNTTLTQAMGDTLKSVAALDWTDANNMPMVIGVLEGVQTAMSGTVNQVQAQKNDLETALIAATNGLGYDGYVNSINKMLASQKLKSLDKAIEEINDGLEKIEKGQMAAAVEFANGQTEIALGEYQLSLTEEQLKSGEEQIQSGLDQMDDAQLKLEESEDKLLEGEQQFADAKEAAYKQADMNKVLTVDTVKGLLAAQNFSMPAGYVTEEGVDFLVRVGDKPESVEDLEEIPLMDLHMDGVPVITLADVADVFYTDNSDKIYTNVNGSAGVILTIQKQTGYSTGEVSDRLGEKFSEMMEEEEDLSLISLMDQGIYIDLVMDSIFKNIFWGFGLAILILIIFLKDLRPTVVVAVSVPISLVTAIVCMYFSNVTLNVISLSGLALGIGMLVDNSIVVIENIYRLRGLGRSVKEAAIEGAKEVAGAIVASTLTTVCVFLPIVFVEGITRQLFVDMGLTIGFSLMASLVIALTVVPAMSSATLRKTKEHKQGRIFSTLVRGYEAALRFTLKYKALVLLLVLVLLGASAVLAASNGIAFMNDMDSTQLTVNVELDQTATLEETAEITDQVVYAIMDIDDVKDVGAMTTSASQSLMGGGDSGKTNATSIYVVTSEDKVLTNEEIAGLILEMTEDLDAKITVDTSTMDMSALGGNGISLEIRGRDLDELQYIATEIADIIECVDGTKDVQNGLADAKEELRIIINRDEAVTYGLTVAQVYSQIYNRLAETASATTLVSADKDYNVYVQNENDLELTRDLVMSIDIEGKNEEGESVTVPLYEIADYETTTALSSINRKAQTRCITVSAQIADGYNIGLVSADVEEALADYELPSGYQLVYAGENEMIIEAMKQVLLMIVLAIVLMYLIMVAQFQSFKLPFIIMFTIPLAFTGGLFGLYFTGNEISVIALIGFVMLAGIIVNNGIVLIDYINQLIERGMDKKEAILDAGRTRLRPVLMTALTTILALSTMAFGSGMGAEMSKPMAVVTIGGLIYGTLLTLLVIPCVYDMLNRGSLEDRIVAKEEKKQAKREKKQARKEKKQAKKEKKQAKKEKKQAKKEKKQASQEGKTEEAKEVQEIKEEVQEEIQEEVQEELQEEVQEEIPEEIQEKVQEEIQEEIQETVQEEVQESSDSILLAHEEGDEWEK